MESTCILKPIAISTIAILLILQTGCDSGPETATVRGTVTFKGKAVTTGTVKFYPVEGGRPAVGGIDSEGRYELSRKVRGDGVLLGEYQVTIEATEVSGTGGSGRPTSLAEENQGAGSPATSQVVYLVPKKYSTVETSGLQKTIDSGDNQVDFALE